MGPPRRTRKACSPKTTSKPSSSRTAERAGGRAEEAFLSAVRGRFELFTSLAILTETANTLRSKFEWSDERVAQALQTISRTATVLKTQPTLSILRDDPDNRILECAVTAQADAVVTGDRHLLALKAYHRIRILKLAEFLTEIHG